MRTTKGRYEQRLERFSRHIAEEDEQRQKLLTSRYAATKRMGQAVLGEPSRPPDLSQLKVMHGYDSTAALDIAYDFLNTNESRPANDAALGVIVLDIETYSPSYPDNNDGLDFAIGIYMKMYDRRDDFSIEALEQARADYPRFDAILTGFEAADAYMAQSSASASLN
jgi:hypothetical protein